MEKTVNKKVETHLVDFKNSLKSLPEHKELCCAICRNQVIQITAPSDEESTGLFEIVLGLAKP